MTTMDVRINAGSFMQPFEHFVSLINEFINLKQLFSDEIWTFFLTYRLQLAFAIAALLVNLVLCVYAFTAGDCYNPHTSMWRTQLVIDILVALGYVLDATSAFRFRKFCYHS